MRKQFLIISFVIIVIVSGYLVWHGHKNNTSVNIVDQQQVNNIKKRSNNKINNLIDTLNNTQLEKEERISAAAKLEAHEEAFESFVQIVTDRSDNIDLRYKATRGLGIIGNREAVPVLSELLMDSQENEHLRIVAALALGNLGGKDAVDALSEAMLDNDRDIRFKAIQGLEATGDFTVTDNIASALKDQDKHVRVRAIKTLGNLGDRSYVSAIGEILDNTTDDFIKIGCIRALGRMGGEKSLSILNPTTLLSVL
jgi:HEAT repeat protein